METPKNFERILLATDGSLQSNAATETAITVAKASAASVRVVHVWNLEIRDRDGHWTLESRAEADDLVEAAVKRIADAGIAASGEILHSDDKHIADAVAAAARAFDANLVVVGSRGLSEWQAMRKHSVSHELLTKLDCPVLVVGGNPLVAAAGLRVMLAIAGGDDVETGVRAAAAAAPGIDSMVLVAHVRSAVFSQQGVSFIERDDEARSTVASAIKLLKERGLTGETLVSEAGPVAPRIADIAKAWGADLIVTGSGRSGNLSALLLGSVAHDLMHVSDRPVLVAARIGS